MQRGSIGNSAGYRNRQLARAKAGWRDAASVVSMRWDAFLQSEAQARALAFKSYVSALDAEEAAAAEMSRLVAVPPDTARLHRA